MVILMSFTFISFSDYEVVNAQENKIYSKATINDEFADDRVLVVLNEEYKNKNYSKNDFESIDCVNLIEYDFDCSNDILRIDLSEKSKSNVLSVSEELLNVMMCFMLDQILKCLYIPQNLMILLVVLNGH